MTNSIDEVLERIKKHEISSEEGYQRIKLLQNAEYENSKEKEAEINLYKPIWKECMVNREGTAVVKNILLFDEGTRLADELKKRGAHVIRIKKGTVFVKEPENTFALNPLGEEDYGDLLNTLTEMNFYPDCILHMWSKGSFIPEDNHYREQISNSILSLFILCKTILRYKNKNDIRLFHVYFNTNPIYAAIGGFIKTVNHETSKLNCKAIEIRGEQESYTDLLWNELLAEDGKIELSYRDGKRFCKQYSKITEKSDKPILLKVNGVYLITGGMGGLGFLLAKYLAAQWNAKLILAGRTELNDRIEVKKKELEKLGAEVLYIKTDVTSYDEIEFLIDSSKKRFGEINGVIHAAGIISDRFIINKEIEEIQKVISPKVEGTILLDKKTRLENLDFFVVFSSIMAETGNSGQGDYSYANSFADQFCKYREELRNAGKRIGKTLSINWPYWEEGGMKMDAGTLQFLEKNWGLYPMSTKKGVDVLKKGLLINENQILVLNGREEQLKNVLCNSFNNKKKKELNQDREEETAIYFEKVAFEVQSIVSKLLYIDQNDIGVDMDKSEYGFDSITSTEFINAVNELYHLDLTPPMFFEHTTLKSFIQYLLINYLNEVKKFYANSVVSQSETRKEADKTDHSPMESEKEQDPFRENEEMISRADYLSDTESSLECEAVAIIGIAGRMPKSSNLSAFWSNLVGEQEFISDIPLDRWNWKQYFGEPGENENKTTIKWGGFMNDVDKFDPAFFGISPYEAEIMDPRQRIFLETVWEVIEDAGYQASDLAGSKTGVFSGAISSEYYERINQQNMEIQALTPIGTFNSILTNRVSYLMNFHGPSETVDTACSGSLVAIHRAIEALNNKECDLAIAGGISLMVNPAYHIAFEKAGMLSKDGKCKTFDQAADGYVRGEGCGVILLKPLSKAKADRDNIYAVIKGSAVNHGGRANSLTAPDPNSQADVIIQAWKKAGIDPNSVNYIETHGTGTALGDPIEILGLKKAYEYLCEVSEKLPVYGETCALGALKTDIGHLEAAAGIASVLKVILCMKNKVLLKNKNFKQLNPYIRLKDSPFYILDNTKEWKKVREDIPRRAGISSFGFGGVNAHILLEDYEESTCEQETNRQPLVFILSAKNKQCLHQYIQNFLEFLGGTKSTLKDIAYTLQVGREGMEERIAVVAVSREELKEKLEDYQNSQEKISNLYQGNSTDNKELMKLFMSGDEGMLYVQNIIRKAQYNKLAQLWTKGAEIDWQTIYTESVPKRVSLPTYPFAKSRYWLLKDSDQLPVKDTFFQNRHPFLQENISDFSGLKYKSVFNGEEIFISNHIINHRKTIPGVVYLEMVRASIAEAMKTATENNYTFVLKDVVWLQPAFVNNQVSLYLSLNQENIQGFRYKIYEAAGKEEEVLHNEGLAILEPPLSVSKLDIEFHKKECKLRKISALESYEWYRQMGIEYGAAYRGMQELYAGEDTVLSKLVLPELISESRQAYILHPSLMDAAIQSTIGFLQEGELPVIPRVPFALEKLEVISSCTTTMWAVARREKTGNDRMNEKIHIDLCKEDGTVCVRMKGLVLRPLKNKAKQQDIGEDKTNQVNMMLTPVWKPISILPTQPFPARDHKIILIGGTNEQRKEIQEYSKYGINLNLTGTESVEEIVEKLEERGTFDHLIWISPDTKKGERNEEVFIESQEEILAFFRLVKALLKLRYGVSELGVSILTRQAQPIDNEDYANPILAGIHGLAGSMAKEYPNWRVRVLDLEEGTKYAMEEIALLPANSAGNVLVNRKSKWYGQEFIKLPLSFEENRCSFKMGGVYVVIGGAGGIGEIFSEYLIRNYDANIIWIGRSEAKNVREKTRRLAEYGKEPIYIQADAANLEQLTKGYRRIKELFQRVDGVVHSAMMLHDKSLMNMEEEQFLDGFRTKADICVRICQVFLKEELDFVLFFSSLNSFAKPQGQSNYVAGNVFEDVYAHQLGLRWKNKVKVMNWGYWGSVGTAGTKEYQKMMIRQGLGSINPEEAMEALEYLLSSEYRQIVFLRMDGERKIPGLRIVGRSDVTEDKTTNGQKVDTADHLKEYIRDTILDLLSLKLKVEREWLDAEDAFSDYGVDSIIGIQFIQKLNKSLGLELETTSLFDYSSINLLTQHIYQTHKKELLLLSKSHGTEDEMHKPEQSLDPPPDTSEKVLDLQIKKENEKEQIAIIGMSGRFPQAKDTSELWEKLEAGKDLTKEADRWDLGNYYQENQEYCNQGGFLDEMDKFDPLFFRISGIEAACMDPQQRIFLEESYRALEDAGYAGTCIEGKNCGIYSGYCGGDYKEVMEHEQPPQAFWGNEDSILPARVAYHLNLKGPAISIDTACSSSLVAVHLACQSLKNKETDMALAGGIFIQSTPRFYLLADKAGMLSHKGHCYAFDERADGFVPGEGVGVLVLKRLQDAVREGDHIYGIIKGSGINQDGATNGITAPSGQAQEHLLSQIYNQFAINPAEIQMMEAHGTGTKLGDPIEYQALSKAFRNYTEKNTFCALGTVKMNLGHTIAAAGVVSIIKILLSMKNKKIPPAIHYLKGNSNISFINTPFYINTKLKAWETEADAKRCAAVSSFGFSGTNAHLVIEEALENKRIHKEEPAYLIVLSANSENSLRKMVQKLLNFCNTEEADIGNMSFTLLCGRRHLNMRFAVVVSSRSELIKELKMWLENNPVTKAAFFNNEGNRNAENTWLLQEAENGFMKACINAAEQQSYLEALNNLKQAFVQGCNLDYSMLFANDQYSRIPLPTYEFDRNRYWAEAKETVKNQEAFFLQEDSISSNFNTTVKFYSKNWDYCSDEICLKKEGTILILASFETMELACTVSEGYASSDIIRIEQLNGLLEEEKIEFGKYHGLIDLTGCGCKQEFLDEWILFLQKVIALADRTRLMLLFVTRGLERFNNEQMNLNGAVQAAAFRMLQYEYKYLFTRHLDIESNAEDEEAACEILKEFFMDDGETEICYRDKIRYRSCLKEKDLSDSVKKISQFPSEKTLLITGGTRGLGFLCAEYFVSQYGVKNLILIGKEALPPVEEWELYQNENNSLAKKIKAICNLKKKGVKVEVISLQLENKEAVEAVIQKAKQTMGPIGGILHAAGMADLDTPAFICKNPYMIKKVMNPKVAGLNNLYDCCSKEPLQFFLLFSSVSAVIPSLAVGCSDYAMANSYMDYFAEAKKDFCPIVSIQWPNWEETGIGKMDNKAYEQTGLCRLKDAEGLQILDRILGNREHAVLLPTITKDSGQTDVGKKDNTIKKGIHNPEPLAIELREKTNLWLTVLFSKELRIEKEKLFCNSTFHEYGIDSVLLAQIIIKMEQELEISLNPSILLEYNTIDALTHYLIDNFVEILQKKFAFKTDLTVKEQNHLKEEPEENIYREEKPRLRGGLDKIAVIGMACHFPDAATIGEFWNNLKEGKDSISEVPEKRWDIQKYYTQSGNDLNKSCSRWGAFLEDIDTFDHEYFHISEEMAKQLDPLQRQVLEVGDEALRDAGYEKQGNESVGVFIGARTSNYADKIGQFDKDTLVSTGQNFIAANLSHIYNFSGPSMVVDTACSSSLTAIHLAVNSLQSGEIDMAVAGGVEILLDEIPYLKLSAARILSPDGHCKTFDSKANGIGIGEGCGVVILKPLEQAVMDKNKIYAVIDGSAINNDGNTMSFTTPNLETQQELLEKAIQKANIDVETISYIEAHGTGTLIGDPIELKALTNVFTKHTKNRGFCGVGSVKSNIGHLLNAAGIASFIKVILAINQKQLPSTIHCSNPNPRFEFETSPFYIVDRLKPWEGKNGVLRAGISSFGLGGSNAHIIVSNEGLSADQAASLAPVVRYREWGKINSWPQKTKSSIVMNHGEVEEEFTSFFDSMLV
nr:SDR family NAD(P)-dependent oxidoreductase [uncultured Clostridium sp.]